MIVVDTNVLAYLLIPGAHTAAAEALFAADDEWTAPPLWRSEFRNVVANYVRRGGIDYRTACTLQEEAEGLMVGAEHDIDSRLVLQLAADTGCSAYDCEFMALATLLDVKLVTLDTKVLKSYPAYAITLPR